MDVQKMQDLRRITRDSNTPMSLRAEAETKYQAELDSGSREFDGYLANLRAERTDESGNVS